VNRTHEAFTLLEVLISITLLFTAGIALIKGDVSIAKDFEKRYQSAELLYLVSPIAMREDITEGVEKEWHLYDIFRFQRLRDDEIFRLKSITIQTRRGKTQTKTLLDLDEKKLNYHVTPILFIRHHGRLRLEILEK